MSGIGRELRYMEYKLRKKHSEWDKERKKTKQNQADKKVPSMKEFTSGEPSSTEYSDALPSDRKEEDLQLQVALAISKEEMNEAERREESDRVRLELALKQSEAAMAEAEAKIKLNQQQNVAKSASNDPWGNATVSEQASFDPFSGAGPSTSSNVKTAADPWGGTTLVKPPPVTAPAADPWATAAPTAPADQPPVVPAADPWATAAPSVPADQPSVTAPVTDPWATAAPTASLDQNDSFSDLFNGSTSAVPAQPQVDPWGAASSAPAPALDPFQGTVTTNITTPATAFDAFATPTSTNGGTTFDPLAEFDQLHLTSTAAPVTAFQPPLTTMEPFVLEPIPINSQYTASQATSSAANPEKAGGFLEGSMSGLIDINSLLPSKPANNPYAMAKPSGSTGVSRNPFLQKSPALSLNQLQGTSQGGGLFGDPTPVGNDFTGLNPTPAPTQPFFNQQVTLSSNPFPSNVQNPF